MFSFHERNVYDPGTIVIPDPADPYRVQPGPVVPAFWGSEKFAILPFGRLIGTGNGSDHSGTGRQAPPVPAETRGLAGSRVWGADGARAQCTISVLVPKRVHPRNNHNLETGALSQVISHFKAGLLLFQNDSCLKNCPK